jgi:hypothetical protein
MFYTEHSCINQAEVSGPDGPRVLPVSLSPSNPDILLQMLGNSKAQDRNLWGSICTVMSLALGAPSEKS